MPLAVITGANRGLGLETARLLASRGYRVWLTGRDANAAEQAARQLRAQNLEVEAAQLDVTDAATVSAFAQRMASEPPIAALVNNAGGTWPGFDAEVAARTLDCNYRGAIRVSDALGPCLAPTASIVMVSSGMGELGHFSADLQRRLLFAQLSRAQVEEVAIEFVSAVDRGAHTAAGFPSNAYSVSKALLNAFTRVLAREIESSGSARRVNAVCPGWVKTRMGGSSAPRSLAEGASGIAWAAMVTARGDSSTTAPNGGFFRDGTRIAW